MTLRKPWVFLLAFDSLIYRDAKRCVSSNWLRRPSFAPIPTDGKATSRQSILPIETRFGFAKAKPEVQKHLDGTIHIFYKGQELPFKPIIPQEDERYVPSQMKALAVGV